MANLSSKGTACCFPITSILRKRIELLQPGETRNSATIRRERLRESRGACGASHSRSLPLERPMVSEIGDLTGPFVPGGMLETASERSLVMPKKRFSAEQIPALGRPANLGAARVSMRSKSKNRARELMVPVVALEIGAMKSIDISAG